MKFKILMLICLLAGACKKENGRGAMRVMLTDAPGDYKEVNVDIRAVEINYANTQTGQNGWVTLPTNKGVYNLLFLQNNVMVTIADDRNIPEGKVNQIRLVLGGNNTVKTKDDVTHNLSTPSATQSGLKINLNTVVREGDNLEVVLDFDADKSVLHEGSDYILKPVLRVKAIEVR